MKLLPSAQRFAKHNPVDTAKALKDFRRQGYGRHMNFMPLVDFENEVYQWAENELKTTKQGIHQCDGEGSNE
jgi:hypothetical protein